MIFYCVSILYTEFYLNNVGYYLTYCLYEEVISKLHCVVSIFIVIFFVLLNGMVKKAVKTIQNF